MPGNRRFELIPPIALRTFLTVAVILFFKLCTDGQVPVPTPPAPSPTPITPQSLIDRARTLSLTEVINRATRQVTELTTANLNSRIAEEDIRQARAAFFPKITAPLLFTGTTPSLANTDPRLPSFIGADAITVYQALLNAAGEIDTSGKLRATLKRDVALVEAARAGSEVARRDLEVAVVEAYYNLALSTAKRRGAESNLEATLRFEENQRLQLEAGEVAPVDLVRARLQSAIRRDELIQADAEESVNEDTLRLITGSPFTEFIAAEDLLLQIPVPGEIEIFTEAEIRTRPEFRQFEAEKRAAEFDVRIAKSDLRPQLTYSISSGFITDSFTPGSVKNHAGAQAIVGFTIPIFDWGANRSRVAQARLRSQVADASRQIAERQFIQAFYTARTQALMAQERISALRQTIADAEANLTTSVARYRAGEGPINEAVDAQNTLIAQRLALYQALFDYQVAKARLARAAGR